MSFLSWNVLTISIEHPEARDARSVAIDTEVGKVGGPLSSKSLANSCCEQSERGDVEHHFERVWVSKE